MGAVLPDVIMSTSQIVPKFAQKVATPVFKTIKSLSKKQKSYQQLFGPLLKENLSPRRFKIAQFGHTGS